MSLHIFRDRALEIGLDIQPGGGAEHPRHRFLFGVVEVQERPGGLQWKVRMQRKLPRRRLHDTVQAQPPAEFMEIDEVLFRAAAQDGAELHRRDVFERGDIEAAPRLETSQHRIAVMKQAHRRAAEIEVARPVLRSFDPDGA
jgi:hypothetical protein